MQRDPRPRGAATGFTFETALENEGEILDGLLAALARNQIPPGTWSSLHLAAVRDDRLAQLAEAYSAVAQGKRLKASPPPVIAEFLYRAGLFSADAANDAPRSMDYWRRALAAFPGHPAAFGRLESVLIDAGDKRGQADLYIAQAHQRPRAEQADLVRRAVTLLEELQDPETDELLVEQYQELLRLDARDDETREKLSARYLDANRPRDVVRLLEQGLTGDPPPSAESARTIRSRLIELYAGPLKELERTMPHVEALLADDPEHEEARAVAERLLEVKALAGRAASALAQATEATGTPADVARILAIELEHTRGPKRRDVLRRLGVLRQDRVGDDAGAYEAFEQALALDATDDDLLRRYTSLAVSLHKELDAGRSLARFGAAARDAHVRARLSAAVGQLYLAGGDSKRARTAFVSVLAMPELPDDVTLGVSRSLCAIYAADRDFRALADALERVALLEPDPELRQTANEELAELAQLTLRDAARSIAAWRRLVDTPARGRALAALEPLYAATGSAVDLAYVLEERSKDETDDDAARSLAFRAAEVLTGKGGDRALASEAWARFSQRFGAVREALAHWIPLLEAEGDWLRLSMAIEGEASLAPDEERAPLFVRLGTIRLQKTNDAVGAIEAFAQALASDATETQSRAALEKLAAAGPDRLTAALVLEPYYRAEQHTVGILRVLDLKAKSSASPEERLAAIEEALAMTEAEPVRAADWIARGLEETVSSRGDIPTWIERLEQTLGSKPRPLATVLTKALGTLPIDSPDLLLLARRAAEAHVANADITTALALYRRGLVYDAESPELLERVDELLQEQGTPDERIAMYRAALEKQPPPPRRRHLMHTIALIQRRDLHDAPAAIATYEAALADAADDGDATAALADLYAETERWDTLLALLERSLGEASTDDARGIRARMAEVATKQGDLAQARAHAETLLADDALREDELVVLERVAGALEDTTMLRAVLARRAALASSPSEQIEWLDRLGDLELSCAAPDLAVATWKRAAKVAEEVDAAGSARRLYERVREVSPDDATATERLADLLERAEDWPLLPPLYAILLEHATDAPLRIGVLMRHARLLAEHLDDPGGALVSAAQAFELASESTEYREVLSTFTMLALRGKATHIFAQAMDDATAKNAGEGEERGQRRAELRMAKARVLSANRDGRDAATSAYRAILDDEGTAETQLKAALHAFESLLSSEPADARRSDRQWLLSWRAERATGADKVAALETWASTEETVFGDADRALELYRRVLELDAENVPVLAAVARLALGKGDAEGAITALTAQRERSEGAARRAVDLEIASTLLHRLSRPMEALAAVSRVLAEAPDEPAALTLATALIADPSTRDAMAKVLETAEKESRDPAVRAGVLRTLLDATRGGATPPDVRGRWFDALYEIHRSEGRADAAFETVLAATLEQPDVSSFWDRAEELARELQRPREVADAHVRALALPLEGSVATALGERGVAFQEEWFEDVDGVVRILERVLEIEPHADWAFDRLKLLFDSTERWTELFALYDRSILTADDARKATLYEDAAQIAKDFANDSERAVFYLEKLLALRPSDAHLVASLERLYERKGAYRELVDLLSRQVASQKPADAQRTRARIAQLWLDELKDPRNALEVAEEMRRQGEGSSAGDVDPYGLIERVMASAPRGPAEEGGERPVRYRAAATLREQYEREGRDADLARLLEVELEITTSPDELIVGHRRIATFRTKLGDDTSALEHVAALVLLDPDAPAYRTELAELAARVGRYDRLADVIAHAGEKAKSEVLRAELMVAAGDVWVTHLNDEERATAVYLEVLSMKAAPPSLVLSTARKVEPLLERASRAWDLLEVLERLAALEDSTLARGRAWTLAARLATSLGDHARAITAWQARLDEDGDGEALDALVELLERESRWEDLLVALRRRVGSSRPTEERQADRARIARAQQDRLGDLEAAVAEWTASESEFGATDESTDALSSLLEKTEKWGALDEKLEAAAARASTAERRATLLGRLGDVARLRRDDPERARTSYDAALAANPRELVARAGLLAMARADVRRQDALQTLLAAFAETDDWQETLALAELRLDAAENDSARVRVLLDSAKLAEERGEDAARAFDLDARAFLLAPDQPEVTAELVRLAAATGSWQKLADSHETVLASPSLRTERPATLGDPVWRAGLRYRLGKVKDEHLADAAGALAVYREATEESPADVTLALGSVDVAARLSHWDAVAAAIVRVSRGLGVAAEDVLIAAEEAAQGGHAWDALTTALASEIGVTSELAPKIARDLEARLGVWHRDRRGDPDAAEAAFGRALAHDATNAELLTWLARIQRRAKGRPLVDSLLRLSQATGGDLELLREAGDVAINALADRALAKSILTSAIALAETRWAPASRGDVAPSSIDGEWSGGPVSVGATGSPAPIVRWAVTELVRIHNDEGSPEKTVDLLTATARLPWEPDESRRMLHDAARLARDAMHDDVRATALFEGLFDGDAGDEAATTSLIQLYETHAKSAELLRLYERLVERAADPDERIRVRLASSALEASLTHPDAAVKLLRSNLTDAPRHPGTVVALVALYESNARFADLADLYVSQAELAETADEAPVAATFWMKAAEVSEARLVDPERAIRHFRRALPLEEHPEALDALARLLGARGDHAAEAEMLGRLLASADDAARTPLTLRLVGALVAASDTARARTELEAAAAAAPGDDELRRRLVAMYEEHGAWEALAELHRFTAMQVTDAAAKLGHLRAAAELFTRRSSTPDAAIPLLEEAATLDPEDRTIKLALADAFVHSTRYPEARTLLRAVIDGFGGRRPKDRGVAHYHLALLEIATGNRAQALTELDAATKIDPGNARILRALAELARDDGQIDRAERSYRALLVALKRPEESTDEFPIVRSEVLLELSAIAAGQGQADRARELIESALESASKNVVEGRRLEQGLREKKDFPTLVRALEARLTRAGSDADRVEVLTELARVLDVELGHLANAFTVRQRILALTPASPAAHEACLALARRVDGVGRYLEDLERIAALDEKQGRRESASALYLRLGQALEAEHAEDTRVLAAYERGLATATAEAPPESSSSPAPSRKGTPSKQALLAIRALDQVYVRLGRTEDRARLLAQRVEIESVEDDPSAAADARYRLAELQLATAEGALEGGLLITQALDLDHDLDRAEAAVRSGMTRHGSDEGLLDLFERIGRNPGREAALLDALERRAELPTASPDVAREAATVAKQSGHMDRAEALLTKYVERATGEDVGWAFEELATLREAAGDAAATIAWKKRAADVATGDDARRLRFEIAKLTLTGVGDKPAAAALYEALFDEDPTDRNAWEPMLDAFRAVSDTESLVRLLARVADQATGDDERTRLRFERVRIMVDALDQQEEAIGPLSDLVADDPNFADAATLLADLLEKSGKKDDLRELLVRQVDAAKDRQDAKQVEAVSLRLAALMEDEHDARAALYTALDWAPDSLPLLTRLESLLQDEDRADERLEIKERLLRVIPTADVEQAAFALADVRAAEGNAEAAQRALEAGFRANPASRALRDKLEAAYRDTGETTKLAELYAIEAQSFADPVARLARLREVASLYAKIPDAKRAAETLAEAFALAPHDMALAIELAAARALAHDIPGAIDAFTSALDANKDDASQRASLLLERANLHVELGADEHAARDLIAVARLGVINVSQSLDVELERVRARAEARGDAPIERMMRLELATVRAEAGDIDAARPLVTELLRREPKDRDALRLIARIEERAERWDAATVAYRRLIPLEEGDLAVDTALRLADACEHAGRLADARGALERARIAAPQDQALRARLERLYESVGAFRDLAEMSLLDARNATDDVTRCAHLKRAGALLVQDGTDPDAAIDSLVEAVALSPDDMECTLLLADAYTVAGRTTEARDIISAQITARAGRRSPELGSLYHRLARIANASGDRAGEMTALTSGLEADAQNGFVASELASLALEIGDIDVATRALRAITLLKDASTSHLPKGLAYQYLGEIARQQGDPKRAMLLLKRALEDDPSLETARSLIEELRAEGL